MKTNTSKGNEKYKIQIAEHNIISVMDLKKFKNKNLRDYQLH